MDEEELEFDWHYGEGQLRVGRKFNPDNRELTVTHVDVARALAVHYGARTWLVVRKRDKTEVFTSKEIKELTPVLIDLVRIRYGNS